MATGTIKRLVRERGFGFILGQDGAELFFHRSALQGEGFDALTEGQAVEFDVENVKVQAFVKKWREKTKMDEKLAVPSWSVTYYDAVYWLAEALGKSGPDREKLKNALENSSYTGITGITYTFTPQKHNGRNGPEDVFIVQVKDGALVTPAK